MGIPTEPFWEAAFRDEQRDAFGQPERVLMQGIGGLAKNALVLDAGCGDGRNALVLARNGFSVRAFDISEAGISKLRRKAKRDALSIDAWVGCVSNFEFDRQYGCVLACGLLQFVSPAVGDRFLEQARRHTLPGGIHVLGVFTDVEPPPDDLAPFIRRLFRDGELRDLYADWHIEIFESYVCEDEHEGGIHHRHAINDLVARKPLTNGVVSCS